MWCEDVFFSRDVAPKDIIRALAQIFEIEENAIVVQYGWWFDGENDDLILMLCCFDIARGDFPVRLYIDLWWDELDPQELERCHVIGHLCDLLHTPALIKGDHWHHQFWTLVRGVGDYQYVVLNDGKLNQSDDLFELEIEDELYRFSQPLIVVEVELGNAITSKYFDDGDFHVLIYGCLSEYAPQELIQFLEKLRREAKHMHREDVLQDGIEWLEKLIHLRSQA
jgi:hypothetical protein